MHDEKLKENYTNSDKFEKLGYEEDFLAFLLKMQNDMERKIKRHRERLALTVRPGVAFDNRGNVIVLDRCPPIMLADRLGPAEQKILDDGGWLYVSVEHVAKPVKPVRVADPGCDPLDAKQFARIRDETRIRIRGSRPDQPPCEPCLCDCRDPSVLLAAIRWRLVDKERVAEVRMDDRRSLARHRLATIHGLGWVHGGTYSRQAAESVLETGIGVRFTRSA